MIPHRPVVVLPPKPKGDVPEVARRLAGEVHCPLQSRRGRTISAVFRDGFDAVLAVSLDDVSYYTSPGEEPFRFHPGMAKNRIGSLLRGEPETLVRAAELKPGDSFFDATLGKATDALVAAHAVGDEGKVVGVEINPIVAAVVRIGLKRKAVPGKALAAAMLRIEVRQDHHLDALRAEADGAYDVVYFDPFFHQQVRGSVDMTPLRRIGVHDAIAADALDEAKRVARRSVVHKVRTDHDPPRPVADWELVEGNRRTGYRVWRMG
jgi:SAM-dependent methyltransferase